jgi:hypothetical protein
MPPPKQPTSPGGQKIKIENPERITLKVKSVRIKDGLEIKRLSRNSIVVLRKKNPLATYKCDCFAGGGDCEIDQTDPQTLVCVGAGKNTCEGICRFAIVKPKNLFLGEVMVLKGKPF